MSSDPSDTEQVIFQGLRVQLVPAPFSKRFLAYCIDMGIVLAIMYPLFFLGAIGVIFVMGVGESLLRGSGGFLGIVLVVIGLLAVLSLSNFYFILQEKKSGTTLGKKLFGLRVTSLDGKPLTLGQAVIRDLMRYIDCTLIFPGLFSVMLSDRRRRLGDLMAGTVVVHSAAREKSHTFMYLSAEEYSQLEQVIQPRPLPTDFSTELKKFAFKTYALGATAEAGLDRQWCESLAPYVGDPHVLTTLPSDRILRFFAERCLQEQYLTQ
jgi:uncharacterized RDD family membrane protein YckC